MKSSRNMVSGAFSQSAIDLEESREDRCECERKDKLKEASFNLTLLLRTEEDVCIFFTQRHKALHFKLKGKVCDFGDFKTLSYPGLLHRDNYNL